MISKLLKGRLLVVISIFESAIYIFLWNEGVKLLSPINSSTLANIVLSLILLLVLLLTWAIPTFINIRSYNKELIKYNPNHFEEKKFGKLFNKYAKNK